MPGGSNMTLHQFLWRAENVFPDRELVSRHHDGVSRFTYSEYGNRVRQLASALDAWGIEQGDRIGTFAWNHHWHHELYYGVPCIGAQLHMVNIHLPKQHVHHTVSEASDRILFIDATMVRRLENIYNSDPEAFSSVKQFVVMSDSVPDTHLSPIVDYESFISKGTEDYTFPPVDEEQPAGLCYTSGTTGLPKGVEYTHKMYWGHTMGLMTGELGLTNTDTALTIVPMYHVNAWGRPFATVAAGAKTVLPGPDPDSKDIAELIEDEQVTTSAAVPMVWRGLLEYSHNHDFDISSLEYVISGGASTPEDLINSYYNQLNVKMVSGYGMTETTPVTHQSAHKPQTMSYTNSELTKMRSQSGIPLPGVQMKVVDEDGNEQPWDGEALGELLLKGPWVTTEYFNSTNQTEESITEDGWFRTGDIVRVDSEGYVNVVDRMDDLVKSGGEWISSVEIEDHLMHHELVKEAAVIAIDHDRWDERPVAFVVSEADTSDEALANELREYVAQSYPTWWAPDVIEFIEEIPKGSTGKRSKRTLRDNFVDDQLRARVQENAPGKH